MASESPNVTLIMPAAGKGPGADGKPCWLLQHPRGEVVLETVLSELDLTNVAKIVIAAQPVHIEKYCGGDVAGIENLVRSRLAARNKFNGEFVVHQLGRETNSAPDTVVEAITANNIEGPIFVKDCDGSFSHRIEAGNYVVGLRLNADSVVDSLPAKSFLQCNGAILTNILEKQVISDIIGAGGYSFQNAQAFVAAFKSATAKQKLAAEAMQGLDGKEGTPTTQRLFVSHLVYGMMVEDNVVFQIAFTDTLEDWKSERQWRQYVSRHSNMFIPLEGVLFAQNTENILHILNEDNSALEPIAQNIKYLQGIAQSQRSNIVITTRRDESRKLETEALLKSHAVPFDNVVYGVMGSMSTMVGAYGREVQHPSAVSYSVPYGSAQLGSVLHLN